jgi:hypothetical protein
MEPLLDASREIGLEVNTEQSNLYIKSPEFRTKS